MNDDLRLQGPTETADHTIDWSDLLGTGADTVGESVWTITPAGPVISEPAIGDPATTTSCYLAGVVLGQLYQLTNTITTTPGERIFTRSLTVRGFAE